MLAKKSLGAAPAAEPLYIEDVYSTYLYTGNGSSQTITNNIDLSTEGGLVWVKSRGVEDHCLSDTARGVQNFLRTNTTGAQSNSSSALTAFNADGFSVGNGAYINASSTNYASFTFRKAEKFFDVVTYTGNGTAGRTVSHNLGSVPGVIIVKRTDTTSDWRVYHRSLGATYYLGLDSTAAAAQATTIWNDTEPTSTVFSVGSSANTNASGGTYVAYLFAHDAGGFGDAGDQSVIKCGSYTGNGSSNGPTIDLGWEPQWVLVKIASGETGNWTISDNMRGQPVDGGTSILVPNTSAAETSVTTALSPTATGFQVKSSGATYNYNGATYIYIAIRRGPMKTPESGTEVFSPQATSASSGTKVTTNFPLDLQIVHYRDAGDGVYWFDRLRGVNSPGLSASLPYIESDSTSAEGTSANLTRGWDNTGFLTSPSFGGSTYAYWNFGRAPGFFDVVCYTGNGSYGRTISHNLGVAPELLIVKQRSLARGWAVYAAPLGATEVLQLHLSDAKSTSDWFANTTPTSSVFSVGSNQIVNENSQTFVAYLFASVTGVSKVGSYTGTGTTLQVNCGFTGGARFVLIKRTDSTGDWYVWDTARGIVSGNDPYLLLNSRAAEVTNTDYIDTYSSGFEISSTAPAAINANGGTFIYLAIA